MILWTPIKLRKAISWIDVFLFVGLICFVYSLVGVVREELLTPYRPVVEIQLDVFSLAYYSLLSLLRVTAGYLLSLLFTFTYGYVAAKSKVAEPLLIPLLDILQSIPVLGFMPVFVLALIRFFPGSNVGLEIAAVIMIFTGQGWNMVFSFYSSLKAVPQELKDLAQLSHLRKWDLLKRIEIPYSMNGLLWNSMLSMAGGWFFLMTIESFKLGENSFRLPGIGSYMAVAYERGDSTAILMGIGVMFFLIIVVDRCVWAPLVVWSERYRFDNPPGKRQSRSFVLELIKKSDLLEKYFEFEKKIRKRVESRFDVYVRTQKKSVIAKRTKFYSAIWKKARWVGAVFGIVFIVWGSGKAYEILADTDVPTWLYLLRDVLLTFVRVLFAVVIGSLWTVPVGVFIGTKPIWTRRLQPVVQVVASFPAPMLFPMIIALLTQWGIGIEFGAAVLMLFAAQWYILFNVISGATLIPNELMEVGTLFRVRGWTQWRSIILPSIFPSLVNGWITAAGGAWNACIVAEYMNFGGSTLMATGIGASITRNADLAQYPALAASVLVMVTVVVLLNRLFWNNLYRLAETKYRLEY